MIRKLVSYFFFGFLVLSLFLYITYRVEGPLNFGSGFRTILASAMESFKKVRFGIPEIPQIPGEIAQDNDFFAFFINIGNFFVQLFNAGTSIINAFIEILTFINCLAIAVVSFFGFSFPRLTPVASLPGLSFIA